MDSIILLLFAGLYVSKIFIEISAHVERKHFLIFLAYLETDVRKTYIFLELAIKFQLKVFI